MSYKQQVNLLKLNSMYTGTYYSRTYFKHFIHNTFIHKYLNTYNDNMTSVLDKYKVHYNSKNNNLYDF